MEPQLLIAALYEHGSIHASGHIPGHASGHAPGWLAERIVLGHAGQHDIPAERGESARFDTAGVVIALLAMIGLMIAISMMGGNAATPQPSATMSRLLTSTR